MDVKKVCLIAPTRQLADHARKLIAREGYEIGVYEAYLESAGELAKELVGQGAQVFISRKGTKAVLESCVDVPVVGIEITLNDFIQSINQAKDLSGRIAFFTYEELSEEIWALCHMLGMDAHNYRFSSLADCEQCVKQAINDGCVFAIGGAPTQKCADDFGLAHITFENSESSILNAILASLQILGVKQEERRKQLELMFWLERYEIIFNHTHDAIIAVNDKGEVDVINSVAAKIIDYRDGPPIGKPVETVIKNTRLLQVIESGRAEFNELMKIGDTMVSANRIPIKVDGKILGAVAAFQDVERIQDREKDIRHKMYLKGHVAKYTFHDILGESAAISRAKSIASAYAGSNSTILISGETGTGKELFAQSIHNASQRKTAQFVGVNCAALPKSLLEAELFGHEEGAFTGASKKGKPGLFEIAHGGTIFLDEISEMSIETQLTLLRVLQEKEIRRIGSDKVTPVDIRVISATNKNLAEEIRQGRFRQDLYYRINVLSFTLPPLRKRKEDIFPIAKTRLRLLAGREDSKLEAALANMLNAATSYSWPGNVRELDNFVERLFVMGAQEDGRYLMQALLAQMEEHTDLQTWEEPSSTPTTQESAQVEKWGREELLRALQAHKGNIHKTADALGISRTTLWRRMKKYNISVD